MELAKPANLSSQLEGFSRLPRSRQIGLVVGAAAIIALIIAVLLWSQKPSYSVLYSNLQDQDAGAVIDALDQAGIAYKVDNQNGAIMVPATQVYKTRIQLASQGLPKGGTVGFESLDKAEGFGVSQFMENARYQRALEGELARSIMTMDGVSSARVHLALPKDTVFVRDRQEPKASVVVDVSAGSGLGRGEVQSIVNLVASGIPDLKPDNVSVVDDTGRLLTSRDRDPEMELNDRQFNYTRRLEQAYISRIENILRPIVGNDGVRAQVVADVDFTVTEQTQEMYNPDTPAVRSEQRVLEQSQQPGEQGIPGALSNEPPGAATAPEEVNPGGGGGSDASVDVKKRSTINYELDKTISHTRSQSGVLQRLSVAVVVDNQITRNEDGEEIRVARNEDEMERIRALVREAVGFQPQRGDSVNVVNASFVPTDEGVAVPWYEEPYVWEIGKQVMGALVVLFLVLGVLRPVLRSLAQPPAPEEEEEDEALAELERQKAQMQEELEREIQVADYETNLQTAKTLARQDPKRVAQVVRSWIGGNEE